MVNKTPVTAAEINKLLESGDMDECLGYLSLVNGIEGAVLCDQEGWVLASGENTSINVFMETPYFLYYFQESLKQLNSLGLEPLDSQIAFGGQKFYMVTNLNKLNRYFLLVFGARGSYDLFKYRVERVTQAVTSILRDKGYFRSL